MAVALLAGTVFYLSTKAVHREFDYTYRIALALLRGHVGLTGPQPSWLTELVPVGRSYYSVNPLGSVLVEQLFQADPAESGSHPGPNVAADLLVLHAVRSISSP